MSVRVLTALDHRRETAIVGGLEAVPHLQVVRRCPDLPDLIAASAAGLGDVAVLSAGLRGLDRDALGQLAEDDVPVIVFVEDVEGEEKRLRQLGVETILPASGPIGDLVASIDRVTATDRITATDRTAGTSAPAPTLPGTARLAGASASKTGARSPAQAPGIPGDGGASTSAAADEPPEEADEPADGDIVAVWGPVGSPGRTTVAVNLAAELAASGSRVLLIDADTYGACLAQVIGLVDEAPGIAAAARAAELGILDLPTLARLAPTVDPGFRILTGMPAAGRWTELRPESLTHILTLARGLADLVIVDCGFSIEDDEELSYDTRAPRRNAATLSVLAAADTLIAVGAADPVGLQRLIRGLQELANVEAPDPVVVVNKVRPGAVGASPERRIAAALERFAGLDVDHFIPEDRASLDRCLLLGRVLLDEAGSSLARERIRQVAAGLNAAAKPEPNRRRRWPGRSLGLGRRSTA